MGLEILGSTFPGSPGNVMNYRVNLLMYDFNLKLLALAAIWWCHLASTTPSSDHMYDDVIYFAAVLFPLQNHVKQDGVFTFVRSVV